MRAVLVDTVRSRRGVLNFGARAEEEIFQATLGADIRYWSISNKKVCAVCGKKKDSTSGEQTGRVPLCSTRCRDSFQEWLSRG